MSRHRRQELAGAGSASYRPAAAWIQPLVAAGSLLALLLASGARAGEVSATQGPLDLGTRVNGVAGGRCQGGQCEVSGGTSAGANLFHRFNRFDTRGEIRGVSIQNGVHSTVVLGVLDPLGSFLNKGISLSSPAHLFLLSPGGLHMEAGAQFFNTPRLTLSTASSLGLGSGRFDVFRTTAAEAALLTGVPIRGKGGLSGDPAEAQRNGLSSGGDLVVDGGLIQVDAELLLDAQGGHLLLQAGSQLAVPGGSVELTGKNVTVAAGALVTTSAQAPAAPVPAPGPTAAPAAAPADPAVVSKTAPTPEAPVLPAAAAAQIAAAGLVGGGGIRISASSDVLVAGQLKALGVAATASGTAASDQAGKGGRIEITGQRVALTGAALDASGPAGGGTVLLGGDVRGANPAVANASTTTVDGASTVRADALAQGDGGTVVAYANQGTEVAGLLSVRGGPEGGNGGFVDTSGATVALSRGPDLAAPLGKGGTWLIDPYDIEISADVFTKTPQQVGLFSTGVNANGDIAGNGSFDLHWFLGDQGARAYKTTPDRFWAADGDLSGWISDVPNNSVYASPHGTKLFKTSFSLDEQPLAQSSVAARIWVDDNIASFSINGNNIGLGFTGFAGGGTELLISHSNFQAGENIILVNVNNNYNPSNPTGLNPSGLRIKFSGEFKFNNQNISGSGTPGSPVYKPTNTPSKLSAATIQSTLNAGGSVIVDTTNALGAQAGNITVNSPINKTAGGEASLSFNAHNNIALNSNISSSSAALNLNLNADIDGNGSGATSLASGARLSLNGGTVTANGPISIAANSGIKDAQIVAPAINSVGGVLENISSLNLDSLTLNGGSLQANGTAIIKTIELTNGSISGSGDLQVTQSFNRSGGTIDGNFSNLSITQASGSLSPGALSAAGPVTLRAQNGRLNLDAPINGSTVLARGASGITLSDGASLTASASSGRAITLDAGNGAFLNNSSAGPAALAKQPGATWAIYAANPTSTPLANLGGLPYNFKQYNQSFDTNQGSNPVLGSGNGLFFANSPTLSVNLTSQVTKTYDGTNTARLVDSNYNITGVLSGDLVNINKPTRGTYDNKNASADYFGGSYLGSGFYLGSGSYLGPFPGDFSARKVVSVSGLSIASATDTVTAVPVYGYILGNSTANASIGTITKAPLTIAATSDSRVYNGTTRSDRSPEIVGLFSGDTLTGLSQMFESKNVLGTDQSTLKVSEDYRLNDGNNGNNYHVFLFRGFGTITPLPLPVTGLLANNKVYDATTVAPLGGSAAVRPLSADVVSVGGTAAGAFSDKNVGVDKEVTVTGVTISGADSGNYNLMQQSGLKADIFKANLAVSGLVANNKVYDATTVAPLGGSAAVSPLSGDEVSVGGTAVGAFAEKNVGSGNAVTVSGVTITGADAGNYNLLQQTGLAATISKRDLVVTGLFANNKVYDATTVAPLGGSAAVSPLSGDVVTLGGTAAAAFSDKNVGIDKAVTVSGVTIAGRDADNYNLLQQIGLKAIISKADLSLTGLLALDKVYDATTVAPLGGSAAVSPFSGDVVTVAGTAVGSFADKNVAQAKAVSVGGLSLSGNDAGNYNLLPLTNLKAAITPAPLQISASSDSKIYDGTTQSSLAPTITQGGLWGDDRLTGLAQTYESKNALGAGQSNLIVSAYTLSDGNNGSNYLLSFLPGLGTINRAIVTPSFTVKSKQYDGNVAAEIAGNSLQGGLAGDDVFTVGASAYFDNPSLGNDKLVTITGYTLSGQAANNYQLSSPTVTSTASITTQQDNDSSLPNDEPIKNEKANPTVGLQLSTISSATASKSVDVDISNIVLLPPGASALESTPAGSTQSQPTPSATAVSATSSAPNQTQPTASATAVTAGSATQEYQESDNRSAEDAKTSLGLSNAPTSEAMSPARLQLVMQSAASFIRKYPARMPNQ